MVSSYDVDDNPILVLILAMNVTATKMTQSKSNSFFGINFFFVVEGFQNF